MSTSILECKLKRHKISYSNENGKIIIGKPKIDYGTLIGLIAFPIEEIKAKGQTTFRSITIEGEELEFSGGFTRLSE